MSKMIFNGLEFVAGQEINNNGMFVDFNNLITSGTYIASAPLSYTAIVDCYILIASINWGSQRAKIYIDGIEVNNLYSSQTTVQTVGYFLKKGQVCTATTDCSQENSGYAVYGLQSGSVSNVQHNYSTSEQLIGTWIDGKPLYEKTIPISSYPSQAYTDTYYPHNIANIDIIVDWEGKARFSNGDTLKLSHSLVQSTYSNEYDFTGTVTKTDIKIKVGTNRSSVSGEFTIRYTKTTD